jgi:RimJ/RimL family protein N-acetyltransferase
VTALRFPDPRLADERVRLRPWTVADLPAVEEAVLDPAIVRFNGLPQPFDAGAWFERMPAERTEGKALRMLIADPADDRLLGAIALHKLRLDEGIGELGYWVAREAREARGRGVATSAVRLLTGWAQERLRIRHIEAIPHAANVASRRLLERCGFVLEGELMEGETPALRYVLTA